MSWREHLQKLSGDQLREMVYLCTGAALLIAVAIVLSGNMPAATSNAAAVTTYGSSGSYTWTAPAGVTQVWVTVVGGGGGGGGFRWSDNGCDGDADSGGGGGSGGYINNQLVPVTPNQQYTVVIGSGGTGGPFVCGWGSPPSGTNGATSTFNGSIVATGGAGASSFSGGAGGTPGGGRGANGALYYAGTNAGGTNGSGHGSGGNTRQNGQNGYVSIALTAPPTLSITGNGQSGTVSIALGESVTVAATYATSEGDTLQKTAINDYQNNLWCGTGNTCSASLWTAAPLGQKGYVFTPTAPGSYVFYPAAQTAEYPGWNNYGKSLLVIAHPVCPAGTHWVPISPGNDGSGPFGLVSNINGHCSPNFTPCPNGQTNPPECTTPTTCGLGAHLSAAGTCVPNVCSDPHAVPPLCGTCVSGYTMSAGGVCVPIPPAMSLSANPLRVQRGNASTITWSVSGLVSGAGTSCSIASNPVGVFSKSMPSNTAPAWSGSAQTGPINGSTVITLSCTGAGSKSITVGLIPSVIEI